MGDAAIAKGMAGSRKYCGIFEQPQRRGRRYWAKNPYGFFLCLISQGFDMPKPKRAS